VLLSAQIGLTMLLLVGAALLTRAVADPASLNPGFPLKDLQAVSVEMPRGSDLARWKAFFAGLNNALKGSDIGPAALTQMEPFAIAPYYMFARRPDEPATTIHQLLLRPVTRNYFSVLGIRIVKGRVPDSDADDREVILNEAAVRDMFPREDPIGKTIVNSGGKGALHLHEVVGVAKDVPVRSMSVVEPVVYQAPLVVSSVIVRTPTPGLENRVRAVAASIEPGVIISSRPFGAYLGDSLAMAAIGSRVAAAVGLVGLVLAIIGAFGVFAFAVESRRREIGIRLALGARAREVVWLLLLAAARALRWGVLAGMALTVAATPVLRQLLFGLSLIDPIAWMEVIGVLAAAIGLATWIPARRAVSVDPVATLRSE
jgi:putative ABC transport system permease protein